MTKQTAKDLNYCKYCAAYGLKGWNCGVTLEARGDRCILPPDVQERFRTERGLEGETKREVKPDFGELAGTGGKYKPFKMRKGRKRG